MDMVNGEEPARCRAYLRSAGIMNEQLISRLIEDSRLAANTSEEFDMTFLLAVAKEHFRCVGSQENVAIQPGGKPQPIFLTHLLQLQLIAVPAEDQLEMPPQPLGELHPALHLSFWQRLVHRLQFKKQSVQARENT